MNERVRLMAALLACVLIVGNAAAQELFIYPSKGQSQEQTEKDKFECYNWARQQTGFDPMQPPTATTPPPQEGHRSVAGGAVGGAAGGAALGAIGGAIAGDAGKGAAIGAATGGLMGGMRSSRARMRDREEQEQWACQQAQQYEQKRQLYNRAYTACLEGKGYTVK
ncbi:MAG: YMGG-like glycine zipper-containing protein [bacterium]